MEQRDPWMGVPADDNEESAVESEPPIRMQPPPKAVLRVANPVLRRLLTSPLAGRMPASMAVLEFIGRRSGRRLAVPVGVHEIPGGPVVFADGGWRHNFAGGRDLMVARGRERRRGRGILVDDPEAVVTALEAAMAQVGAFNLAMRTTPGREVTRDDLRRLGRHMVRLELDG